MNSMDLIKAFSYIDDDLVFDAANDSAQPQKSAGIAPVKQPKHNKPQRGGAKAKAILIGALACVCVAAMVCAILYFTGVFDIKQIPIYQGMEISSVAAESSQSDKSAASYSYSGDYVGKGDDVDNETPFGDDSATLEQEAQSTLSVTGAGESIYYADAGDDIYITIKFSNPDSFEILSFVINGEKYTNYMFQTGSDLENIIIKVNVGSVGGIIEYTISEIKYVDGTEIKDVTMEGDPVVKCGVRTSDITYASISDEEVTFTSISFTAEIVDLYSLVEYSGGYLKAVLYDGESLAQIADLEVGDNYIKFTNLTPNTLYQYAIVGYYDNLSGDGVALNYLYTNALYTTAVVLFDNIEVGQESIAFDYNWTEGYESQITSLTLTGGGATQNLSASATSATGLLSDTDYTLTATYSLAGGGEDSISIEFTTLAKTAPELSVEFVDSTASSLTFNVDYTDPDGVGTITAIGLYNGATLVKSESNLNSGEYTFSGLSAYTKYTIKVVYSYNLNDGTGTQIIEESLIEYTDPVIEVNSITLRNSSIAVNKNGTIVLQLAVENPSGATYSSVVVNGYEYSVSSVSTDSDLYVNITVGDEFDGGLTTLNVTEVICVLNGETYTIEVNTNTVTVFINGELSVENFSVMRLVSGNYEEVDYTFAGETLYYVVSLDNSTDYDITSVTIDGLTYSEDDVCYKVSQDKQTVYVSFTSTGDGYLSAELTSLSYINGYMTVASTKSPNLSVTYFVLSDTEVVEISTAEDLKNITGTEYKYYKLMNNISLTGYAWVNISNCMYGIFDGNGYTISGMSAVDSYSDTTLYLGLFTYADGYIINLTMSDIFYNVSVVDCSLYVGGIVSHSDRLTVKNCTITAAVQVTCTRGTTFVGGAVGCVDDAVISGEIISQPVDVYDSDINTVLCVTAIESEGSGSCYVGGVSGYGSGGVNNCNVNSIIEVSSTNNGELDTIGTSGNYGKYDVRMGGLFGCGGSINVVSSTLNTNLTLELYCKAAGQIGFAVVGWFDYGYVGAVGGTGKVNVYDSDISSTIKSTANSMVYAYLTSSDIGEISGSTINADCTFIDLVSYFGTTFSFSTSKAVVTESTLSYTENGTEYTYAYDSDGNLS